MESVVRDVVLFQQSAEAAVNLVRIPGCDISLPPDRVHDFLRHLDHPVRGRRLRLLQVIFFILTIYVIMRHVDRPLSEIHILIIREVQGSDLPGSERAECRKGDADPELRIRLCRFQRPRDCQEC